MDISEDQAEQIINFGVFSYSADKISSIMGLPVTAIQNEMDSPHSKFNLLLQKGVDMSDYVIDLKLFEMAKTGDIKALDKLNYRKKQRNG